jgi:23S rRNA-/tRNA-specific pseudouridylate synthase
LRETDGILELATTTLSLDEYSPQQVIQSSLDAFSNSKRCTAGIINAWIGSCFERKLGAQFALQLLDAYDQVSDEFQIYPDIVTYSLVYSILVQEEEYQEMAQKVLERAQRVSKKKAGSKRRRELAAARRRPQVSCATNVQDELQELYGCDFQVLQETSDFLVLSKPSGMACTHKHKTTAGKAKKRKSSDKDISLVNALLDKNVPLSTLNAEGRGLVHRIDRGTSGCIVLAKTDEMHAKLVTQFFLRRAKKTYTAVVTSQPAALVEAEIDMPVDGRPAMSKYRVTKQYDSGLTTIQVETMTGRKHQVRVHCAKGLNAPILYDPIYSDGKESAEQSGRFLLHASSLVIPDFDIDAQAPDPSWWEEEISNVQ